MICKNCKTAVEDKAKQCNNCGVALNNNSNKWLIIIVLLVVAAIFLVYFLTNDSVKFSFLDDLQIGQIILPDQIPTNNADIQEKPVSDPQPEPNDMSLPANNTNFEKSLSEVWEIVDEAVNTAGDYYAAYSETVVFLTKNGYLFDNPAKAYVLFSDMDGLSNIDLKYLEENLRFFYLKPKDIFQYSYLRVSESDRLKIFVGLETKEGFAIAAENEQGGIINREDLMTVLDKYSWDHGEIRKIEFQSDEFEQVIKTLVSYTGHNNGFDVRYVYRDNKYMCVVASPKGRPMEVSQYILQDTEDILIMEISEIETIDNYRKFINEQLPDFNQGLLPAYDLGNNLKYLKDDFSDILEAMLEAGFIADYDSPYNCFASGTSDFVYFEFESGKRFVGNLGDGTWKLYPIENDEMGRELMQSINKKAPVFIIKQQ